MADVLAWGLIVYCTFWLGSIPLIIHLEKKEYNGGVCKKCGGHLSHHYDDSQGGHYYFCDNCDNGVCIHWIRRKDR